MSTGGEFKEDLFFDYCKKYFQFLSELLNILQIYGKNLG